MNALVACDTDNLNEFFAIKLVAEGLKPFKAKNTNDLFDVLENKEIDVLLLDFDSSNYSEFETIKSIRATYYNVILILFTSKTGFEFAKRSVELGIYGFVSKTNDIENQFERLKEILENLRSKRKELRRHMRVKPDSSQINSAKLEIPGLPDKYRGKVMDISVGGVAIQSETVIPDMILFTGKITILEVELGMFQLHVKAQVVLKRGTTVGFRFRESNDTIKRRLSEYVISRLDA